MVMSVKVVVKLMLTLTSALEVAKWCSEYKAFSKVTAWLMDFEKSPHRKAHQPRQVRLVTRGLLDARWRTFLEILSWRKLQLWTICFIQNAKLSHPFLVGNVSCVCVYNSGATNMIEIWWHWRVGEWIWVREARHRFKCHQLNGESLLNGII